MPQAWTDTVDTHRRATREAILDAAWGLVCTHGVRAVTMGQLAGAAGIGRATLYKYFPDLEAVLTAWHRRQVDAHLAELTALGDRPATALERLTAVLTGWAHICHRRGRHGPELAALVHHQHHTDHAEQRLDDLLTRLLAEAAHAGEVRDDIDAHHLARYCRHALGAATELDAHHLDHLVALTLSACGRA